MTHDLLLAREICDRLAVMHRGALVEVGPAHQVVDAPRHEYTRALVDAVPDPFAGGPATTTTVATG